jgi:ribosome-associated toxin RatA of RatAB toxin-antitoxin module
VREVKVSTVISASCEDVFDLVEDLSRRPSFTDHYLKDFRLARSNPRGLGASARFLLARRVFSERAETRIVECDRPRRVVEEGRIGRRAAPRCRRSTSSSPSRAEAADSS